MAPMLLVIGVTMVTFILAAADTASVPVNPSRSAWPADDKIYQLFYNLCLEGNVGEAGIVAPTKYHEKSFVYCRQPGAAGGTGSSKPQVIFVEPPALDQKHNVIVNAIPSPSGNGPNTKVYVVPPKVTNQYNVELKPHSQEGEKPAVYYLKGAMPPPPPLPPIYQPRPKNVRDIMENLPGSNSDIPWGV